MSSDGVLKFIATIELDFPRPKFGGDDDMENAWVASRVRSLGGWNDEVLAEAADVIMRTRNPRKDGRFFPVLQECEDACREAAAAIERRRAPLLAPPPEIPYEARIKLARDLMQSPMGNLAKREGWGTSMFYFCVNNMRVPGGREIDQCKREAKEFTALYEDCLRGAHPLGGPLSRLAENITSKAKMERPS